MSSAFDGGNSETPQLVGGKVTVGSRRSVHVHPWCMFLLSLLLALGSSTKIDVATWFFQSRLESRRAQLKSRVRTLTLPRRKRTIENCSPHSWRHPDLLA